MKKMVKSLIAAIGVALMMTGSVFAADVAKIGDTNYTTLADAVAVLKANGPLCQFLSARLSGKADKAVLFFPAVSCRCGELR